MKSSVCIMSALIMNICIQNEAGAQSNTGAFTLICPSNAGPSFITIDTKTNRWAFMNANGSIGEKIYKYDIFSESHFILPMENAKLNVSRKTGRVVMFDAMGRNGGEFLCELNSKVLALPVQEIPKNKF